MDDALSDVEANEEAPVPREERRKGSPGTAALVTVLAVLVLYPLSLGPVLWLFHHEYLTVKQAPIAQSVYSPLEEYVRRHMPMSDAYLSYLRLWVPGLPEPP